MKRKVLLIDDDADTLKTYADILTAEGYEVTTASSGEEALAIIDGDPPDVILLDLLLPDQNGIDVARTLAQRTDVKHIPIVVVTALTTQPTDPAVAGIEGIRRFVYKPCRPRTLVEAVEDAIRYQR